MATWETEQVRVRKRNGVSLRAEARADHLESLPSTYRARADRERRFELAWRESVQAVAADVATCLGERRGLVITTPTVAKLYAAEFLEELRRGGADIELLTLACTEREKTLDSVLTVCREARQRELGRRSVLIALGGGVCSDIVTVAASMIRRGISHIRVPTTLLAQVDAGVGIKGAVHLDSHKNHLGCFHPPERVVLCPSFLSTLERRQLRSGMAEVVKVALAGDAVLFESLEEHGPGLVESQFATRRAPGLTLMARAIEGLLAELEPNFYEERSLVRSMDLGHTFSPAMESESDFELLHGEAVAIDMALSTVLAAELNWLSASDERRILGLLDLLGLPRTWESLDLDFCVRAAEETIRHRGGDLNLFLPTGIGRSRCLVDGEQLTPALLGRALARLAIA